MLSNNIEYKEKVIEKINLIYNQDLLPITHQNFLFKLRNEYNFHPKVCYDIGSAVLHWTRHAERVWKDTKIILFDAFEPYEYLYKNYDYNIGVLSDVNNKIVKFYQNDFYFGGNSYYKENTEYFPEDGYLEKSTKTLDTIVEEKKYPYPDLIKVDVQGAEYDIFKGAQNVLSKAKVLLVELQHIEYNKGARLDYETINYLESINWKLEAEKFSPNGVDSDYCFINKNLQF